MALALLPVVFLALAVAVFRSTALRPGTPDRGGSILGGAILRASVLTGAVAIIVVEIISLFGLAHRWALAVCWLVAAVVLAIVLIRRHRTRRFQWKAVLGKAVRWPVFPKLTPVQWGGLGVVAVLAIGELVAGLATIPSTQDSLTYHLARIEHWRQNGSVWPYPASIFRQVMVVPGAEYLMFTIRVLGDSIRLTPLVQWLAGLGSLVAVHRITGQLGLGGRGRMFATVFAGTGAMFVLQSSSTQNDLVVAFFLTCFVSFALEFRSGGTIPLAVFAGLALGLAVMVKSTAYPLAIGFGLWWVWLVLRQRWRGIGQLAAATGALVVIAAPFLVVTAAVWGSPFGSARLATTLVSSHDPTTIAMNAVKIGATQLTTGNHRVDGMLCGAVRKAHQVAGREVYDSRSTFGVDAAVDPAGIRPCEWQLNETAASDPVHIGFILVGFAVTLALARRRGQRAYAAAWLISVVAVIVVIAWQPWISRLTLGAVLLGCPLVAVAISAVRQRTAGWRWYAPHAAATAVVLAFSVATAVVVSVSAGPRGFWTNGFNPTASAATQILPGRPELAAAANYVRTLNVRRIGVIEPEESPEFAIWVLTGAIDGRRQLVALDCAIPGQPPSLAGVDAIISDRPLPGPQLDRSCRIGPTLTGWTWRRFPGAKPIWVGTNPPVQSAGSIGTGAGR